MRHGGAGAIPADLERLALGADAWNLWADERCCERAALESSGNWAVSYDGTALNDPSRQWLAPSSVDFSGHEFVDAAHFDRMFFPGPRGARLVFSDHQARTQPLRAVFVSCDK